MKIEFLYWEECASHEPALQRLREVLAERGIADPVQLIEVTTDRLADALRFPGSPTIRINGHDLFPAPEGPYGLTCRVYHTDDGRVTPLPTAEMLQHAVDAAVSRTRNAERKRQREE